LVSNSRRIEGTLAVQDFQDRAEGEAMPIYLVSYDLLNQKDFGQYEVLIGQLQRMAAKRLLPCLWVLRSSNNSIVIRDSLLKFVHTDDRVLVSEINPGNWAGWKISDDLAEIVA
jgi:hypothetical protein